MRDNITVALIGAGRIGQEHAKNLASFPEVQVALVCDPVIEAARRVRPLARAAEITDSAEEVFVRTDIEAVVICTPTNTHAEMIERAARSKKAVFCEKPVALDLERTHQALEVVRENGVPFQIGFQRRFDSGYAEAKRRVDAGALGRIDQFRAVGRDPDRPRESTSRKAVDYLSIKPFMNSTLLVFWLGKSMKSTPGERCVSARMPQLSGTSILRQRY